MTVPAGDLLRDTSLEADPSRPGRYRGAIPESWRVVYAFGGVTMTAALRTMEAHLARPELPLVTANAIFCAPVPCGPIAVDVEVLRDGRGAAQVGSNLFVPGTDGVALRTHGVFGRPHDTDLAFRDVEFPARRGAARRLRTRAAASRRRPVAGDQLPPADRLAARAAVRARRRHATGIRTRSRPGPG